MGWALGAVEVIALIVFMGYAVTYSLHIAHKYGDFSPVAEESEVTQIVASVKEEAAVDHSSCSSSALEPAARQSSPRGDVL